MTAYDDYVVAREVEKATEPTKWWRALDPDGQVLAETSNCNDFENLDLLDRDDVKIERLYEATLSEWREERK